jgi:hypothetical protein
MELIRIEKLGNLLFLIGLILKNQVFDPALPIFGMCDTSMVESSAIVCQWLPDKLQLVVILAKFTIECKYEEERGTVQGTVWSKCVIEHLRSVPDAIKS